MILLEELEGTGLEHRGGVLDTLFVWYTPEIELCTITT